MRSAEGSQQREDGHRQAVKDLIADALTALESSGTQFGDYVLFERLGRGAFGIVFRARHVRTGELVALKQMRGGDQATTEERRAFLAGAATSAALAHPGIARVLDMGEWESCPFFTMELQAADLAAALELGQPSQAQAARWLRDIALAVHHAHSNEVLHCDLKPANILLNEAGNPLVADFGSAKRLSQHGNCSDSGGGQIGYYMAPEQGPDALQPLTRRTDIYSLGVILYELLTGQVPHEQLAFLDWLNELATSDPVRSPREIEPGLTRDLELICLKCLEKEPSQRYESAAHLAEDLDLVLSGWHPRHARPERLLARAARWVRRRPLRAALSTALALLVLTLVVTALLLGEAERDQQRSALETNAFIANSQAGALLFQLHEFADRAERCAQLARVRTLLSQRVVSQDASALESCARGFRAAYVVAADGQLLAQWPMATSVLGKNYEFRAYFRGARELAARAKPGGYLGAAFRAESNGELQFAFSAPVFGNNGEWIGSVITAQAVDSAMGQVRMQDSSESGRIVALLGPRDKDRTTSDGGAAHDFDFIVHPALLQGTEVTLHEPSRATLDSAFGLTVTAGEQFALRWAPPLLLSDYRDPLLDPAQRSLAAFAPVGRTGYVVVVETSKDAVRRDGRALAKKLATRAGSPLAVGLSLLGLAVFASARRRRRLEARPSRRRPHSARSATTA